MIYALIILLISNIEISGHLKTNEKIIGGYTVENRAEFSYLVSLQLGKRHFCGGSILDEKHVLTAAHCCIDGYGVKHDTRYLTILSGSLIIDADANSQRLSVQHIFPHKNFDIDDYDNDICIIRINGKFVFDNFTAPVGITQSNITPGMECTTAGWGDFIFRKFPIASYYLRAVNLTLHGWSKCKKLYKRRLSKRHLCAGIYGSDTCIGDSGGPLVCDGNITGITSFGYKCGLTAGVYVNVKKYSEWIDTQKVRAFSFRTKINNMLFIFVIIVPLIKVYLFK